MSHNEDCHNLYSSPNQIKVDDGTCMTYERDEKCIQNFSWKT
jgi:hypothetical protein